MLRNFLLLLLAVVGLTVANAQQPLPLNPDVKHGVLSNGLNYYVLHNEYPKNRANFYIVQKVGSALETPEQYGLAHFLEHMAFNGTKHFPGKSMLKYLESKGIRFGADVNAYTDYEETVYNIDNVSADNTILMDSVLLALRDWSCDLSLEDEEIDAERKVIQEEWRMRNDTRQRFRVAMAPVIFSEPQYHQTPIGIMDVVMNFPYEALRDYYRRWYRPDQQGIVVVGDFDPVDMEQKIVETFSNIPMPANAPARDYVHVSDNESPLFFAFEDPELEAARVDFQVKFDMIPLQYRNTDIAFINDLLQEVLATMINNRLSDHLQDSDCRYANAGVYFAEMYPSKTKGIFNIAAIAKYDELSSFEDALSIVIRALKTGFSQSELDRASDEIKAQYDKRYNERNNTPTSVLAKGLINAFKDNLPTMGIEAEKDFAFTLLSQIPLEAYNAQAAKLITPENQVLLIQQQKQDGKALPTREESLALVSDVLGREYEAYADVAITESLIAKLPQGGSISKETAGPFGTKEFILSNGIKVIVKLTDYKEDEILFQAFRKGGKQTYDLSDAYNVQLLEDAFSLSDLGPFDNKTLTRYLTGKNVSLSFGTDVMSDYFEGISSVKDLPTLMELIYVAFTDVRVNEEVYRNAIARILPQFEMMEKSPEYIFQQHKDSAMHGGNLMTRPINAEILRNADYAKTLALYRNAISNPADYTFLFTGNVDIETLKPLLKQYVASLKTNTPRELKKVTPIDIAEGLVTDNFNVTMTAPGDWLCGIYTGSNLDNSIENQVKVSLVGDILAILYTDILREKEGGCYSPHVYSTYDLTNGKWIVTYFIQTNEEQRDRMLELSEGIFLDLLEGGTDSDQFSRVKGALLSQYENNLRTNSYWHNQIRLYNLLGKDFITGHREAIEKLSLDDFNSFLKAMYDGKNKIQVNMHGIGVK